MFIELSILFFHIVDCTIKTSKFNFDSAVGVFRLSNSNIEVLYNHPTTEADNRYAVLIKKNSFSKTSPTTNNYDK